MLERNHAFAQARLTATGVFLLPKSFQTFNNKNAVHTIIPNRRKRHEVISKINSIHCLETSPGLAQ